MSCLVLSCLDAFRQPSHLPLFYHPNNIWRRGGDDITSSQAYTQSPVGYSVIKHLQSVSSPKFRNMYNQIIHCILGTVNAFLAGLSCRCWDKYLI
jgi:hypothetical protein